MTAEARLVTVDGPAGSGKTTLGRRLGVALGLPLIDTGLFYRAVMVAAVRAGLDQGDDGALGSLATTTRIEIHTDPSAGDGAGAVCVDGVEAGGEIRDPAHALLLSRIAGIPAVRQALLERQRALAAHGAVAVGRDCGTVIFPGARVKLFLDAPGAVRTQRREAQLRGRGWAVSDDTMHHEIHGRDTIDSERSVDPLRAAPDAHHIDTGGTGIEGMVRIALDLCLAAGLVGERA